MALSSSPKHPLEPRSHTCLTCWKHLNHMGCYPGLHWHALYCRQESTTLLGGGWMAGHKTLLRYNTIWHVQFWNYPKYDAMLLIAHY